MLKTYILSAAAALVFFLATSSDQNLCSGIFPDNDLYIPPSKMSVFSLTESEFDSVLDRVEKHYAPIIRQRGGVLSIRRLWSDGTVNASAMRRGNNYIVNMYGGLARHEVITADAFALVACHEVGHHLAGAPKRDGWFGGWASNEGQSDYFAGLKCFRRLFTEQELLDWVSTAKIHPTVEDKCTKSWPSQADQALCMKFAMAGKSITQMFKDMKFPDETLDFDQPDPSVVRSTFDGHPHPQCRLDTYFASALCNKSLDEKLSDNDPEAGTCNRSQGTLTGTRPLCWYRP